MVIGEIIIDDIHHIETVYELVAPLRKQLRLSTPYAAVASAGIHYFLEAYREVGTRYPDLEIPFFVDSGPYPGYALAALRGGAKNIYVDLKDDQTLKALQSMARKAHAILLTAQDRPARQLDLLFRLKNVRGIIQGWLENSLG